VYTRMLRRATVRAGHIWVAQESLLCILVNLRIKRVRVACIGIRMFIHKLVFSGIFLASIGALAADVEPKDTIIVTATRTEIELADAIVPVTVIGRDQIEQSMATDLAELLRFEAGLDIGRTGGPGQSTSVFLRGTESNHTLVLVDGVRINPGTIGGAAIQHIAPEVIERVEIVKGTRSSLYGTDAIGGVINVITRRAASSYLDVSVGGGSFDYQNGALSGGKKSAGGEFGATFNWQQTDGYEIRTDSDIERGYDNFSASIYGIKKFSWGEAVFRHWRAEGNVEYLDFFLSPLDQDFVNASTSIELNGQINNSSDTRLIVSYTKDDIEQNQSDSFVTSERVTLDWQYNIDFAGHTLAAGLYLSDEDASTFAFGSGFDESTLTRALFLQDGFYFRKHRVFLAARYSDHETFGGEFTWNADYAYLINDRWTINAGIGHAFRAPDASDRYGFGGSVDLQPEIADEIQLSAEFRPVQRQTVRLELYHIDIEDLIEFDLSDFALRNIGSAEIRGAQLSYQYDSERFSLQTSLVKQGAENATERVRLLRRAEESLSVTYTQKFAEHRLGLTLLATGDREDFGVTLPGYVLTNLTGRFQIRDRWQLNARIENVLDEQYETAAGFRMQERSAYVELTYHWR